MTLRKVPNRSKRYEYLEQEILAFLKSGNRPMMTIEIQKQFEFAGKITIMKKLQNLHSKGVVEVDTSRVYFYMWRIV